jgi:DNA invertase Pin-like site-specific DNA recombinase
MELALDQSLTLHDLGMSAYHSKNLKEGALGKFLEAVSTGKVKRGSVLIIESLDRLSRDTFDEAMALFLDIIRAGIDIHTLNPERQYDKQSLKKNPALIMEAIITLLRANEESEIKSYRSRKNWLKKFSGASTKPITTSVPRWLEVIEGKIQIKPNAAQTITQMVKLSIAGKNCTQIAKYLNANGISSWTGNKLWDRCYVLTVLRSRALIGEFQPMLHQPDGTKLKHGNPITNYYPAIISQQVFTRLQGALDARRKPWGRSGEQVNNLFKGLLRDAIDSSTFFHTSKDAKGSFLVNRNGVFGKGEYRSIRAVPFERAFLNFIQEVRLIEDAVIDDTALLEAGKADLEERIADTKSRIATNPRYASLLDVLCDLEQRKEEIESQMEMAAVKMPSKKVLQEAQKLIVSVDDNEARQKIRQRVRELIREIWLLIEVKGKGVRTCHCQVFFKNDNVREFWLTTRRKGCEWAFQGNTNPAYDLRKYSPESYQQAHPKTFYGLRFSPIALR